MNNINIINLYLHAEKINSYILNNKKMKTKKTYEKPMCESFTLVNADIIATSGGIIPNMNPNPFDFGPEE